MRGFEPEGERKHERVHFGAKKACRPQIDEVVEESAKRELIEEMGLVAEELEFFCVNSGPEAHYVYPNGDEVSNIELVYICRRWLGEPRALDGELTELRFFAPDEIRLSEISPPIRPVIVKLMEKLANP